MSAFIQTLKRQAEWDGKTFGPGIRTHALVAHVRKELDEIEANPRDPMERIDVMILMVSDLLRWGYTPEEILDLYAEKVRVNVEDRTWPDPSTVPEGQPIEHVREAL